ncbi:MULTISPECIES: PQQ-dependent sugar dehydrogenase [Sphingobacterium]|uniref:PQQ-dependent sugar dehydrogenase n=1 Tax=Sphingobacterium TaxID=28453 RepID=UPI0013DD2086|nr:MULTISPECIES: PQQ-dependent sugar dehydrogenase [unclassified Sphingobacterium]
MKSILSLALLSSTLVGISCNNGTANENVDNAADSTLAPVETQKANADYKPAFVGQTRVPGVKTNTPFEGRVIAEGLKSPWGIVVLPDGRFLVTEKEGNMRIVDKQGKLSEAITGLPKVDTGGQGGLLGVALDPQFATNRMVYWTFAEPSSAGNQTAVAKGRLANDYKAIENAVVIYRAGPVFKGNLHYGGRIIFDKNGNLFVTTGERSDLKTRPMAQDLKTSLGKIVRITNDGKPVANNPFEGNTAAIPEIYSYGHRNPQGIAFHPETGDLWETEFGPRGGDELNRVEAGKNYGWPDITYGIEYSGKQIGTPPIQQKEGMEQPVYYWDPVLSPSGITFYTGSAIPEWKNNLFITGLSSMHIARLVIRDNKVIGEERLLSREGQRFRDIVQGADEALYTITDGGKLYRIGKK